MAAADAVDVDDALEEVKKKAVELLDADGDGKLSLEDAKLLAVSMTAKAHGVASSVLVSLLDKDGDGAVSWSEVEGGARGLFYRTQETFSSVWVRLAPYKTSLLAGAGVLSCFYGRNFKYSVLFAQTFAATGWPMVKPALRELGASYSRGKRAFVEAAPELKEARATLASAEKRLADCRDGDDAARARLARDAAKAAALLKTSGSSVWSAVDPKKLWAACSSAYLGLATSFASVLSASAARLGIGMEFGTAVADAVNAVAAPVVSKLIRAIGDRLSRDPTVLEAMKEFETATDVDDDTVKKWVESVIGVASTALGVYVAHRLDDVVYLGGACLTGAQLAIDQGLALAPDATALLKSPKAKAFLVSGLAACGFVYQAVLGFGDVPLLFRLPLLPLSVGESFLSGLALSIRGAGITPP